MFSSRNPFTAHRSKTSSVLSSKTRHRGSTDTTRQDRNDVIYKTFQLRSLTLDPQKIRKEESFYNWRNVNDNYTKPIRFHNVNRPQTVALARKAFSELTSAKRSSARMPCMNGKTTHRRLPAPGGNNYVFLTQGDRSREPTNVSLRASPPPVLSADDLEDEVLEPVRPKLDVDDIKRRLYQKECTRVGVTPVGKFLRSPTQSEISIRYYNLGSSGAKALSVPLMLDSTMTTLDLEGNAIGDEGIANMAEMLEDHCSIKTMNLNRNNLTTKSAALLCKVLLHNRHIHSLTLAANKFDDRVGQIFADMLKENHVLKRLDLSDNSLGEVSGKAIGDALSQNETLEHLNLAWNKFRGKGASRLLDGIKENIGLKWLNLSYNSLSRGPNQSSPDALGGLLANNTMLAHLDLTSSQLNDLDMLGVAKGLKVNEALDTMKIGHNLLQAETISLLLRAMVLSESSKLTLLDMHDMVIEKAALEDIETLGSRGVKVIHGPVHQTETSFLDKTSSSAGKQVADDDAEEDGADDNEETTSDD